MINLTKNAFKHTHNSKVIIKTAYDTFDELLHVSVIDFGKGLSNEDLAKIKKEFADKEPVSCISSKEGIGMELSTCKSLVHASGGTIEVFSKGLNKGSTFKFSMKMKTQKNSKKGEKRNRELI